MEALFSDCPQALENTNEIVSKVELYDIDSAPLLPDFPLPEGFTDAGAYLQHLVYRGAQKRYGDPLDGKVRERIDFELETIKNVSYPEYFLIIQEIIAAARDMGALVGPGRGSSAGSVVAYCLRITEIDPVKYDLLFERFLNPDCRVRTMPGLNFFCFPFCSSSQSTQITQYKYRNRRILSNYYFR